MNSDSLSMVILSREFPTGHPLQLPPAGVSATGTTQTAFLLSNGNPAALLMPLQTDIRGSQVIPDPVLNPVFGLDASPSAPLAAAPWANSQMFDNAHPFRVRATGTFVSGNAANTLTLVLALGTSATFGSDTSFYAPTAATAIGSGAKGNFYLETTCLWDSNSGKIGGIGETLIEPGTSGYSVRGGIAQVSIAAPSSLNFVLFYTWGVGASANTIALTEFAMERV